MRGWRVCTLTLLALAAVGIGSLYSPAIGARAQQSSQPKQQKKATPAPQVAGPCPPPGYLVGPGVPVGYSCGYTPGTGGGGVSVKANASERDTLSGSARAPKTLPAARREYPWSRQSRSNEIMIRDAT